MKKGTSLYSYIKDMSELIDLENSNNHAWLKRLQDSEKAELLLKVINEYRLYAQRFESLPTRDVLSFLSKLQKNLFDNYGDALNNGERDKLREEYFMKVGKKPFWWWDVEKIKEEIAKFEAENKPDLKYLKDKKSRWQK
jgi:hypothetical protein